MVISSEIVDHLKKISFGWNPNLFEIFSYALNAFWLSIMVMMMPCLPNRPVRPERWRYTLYDGSVPQYGKSALMIIFTSGKSTALRIKSVATRILISFCENLLKICSLSSVDNSPVAMATEWPFFFNLCKYICATSFV